MTMPNNLYGIVLVYFHKITSAELESLSQYAMEDFGCDGVEAFSLEERGVDEILQERAYSGGDLPMEVILEVDEVLHRQEEIIYKFCFYTENFKLNAEEFFSSISKNYRAVLTFEKTEDWNANWKKHYLPIEIDENFYIVPSWLKNSFKHLPNNIYIYPGMGFGTGSHETTFLCLRLYNEIIKLDKINTVLDMGCGSGILGIAAIRINQSKVEFCDIDREALGNCLQNLNLNFDQDLNGCSLVIRDRFQPQKYDLVFANILESAIKSEMELLVTASTKHLILSGLLVAQLGPMISSIEQYGFDLKNKLILNDWGALWFTKSASEQ